MKKLISIVPVCILFISALVLLPAATRSNPKPGEGKKPIPAEVMKIIKTSCLNCHADHGNVKARAKVNLSRWDNYTPVKQADNAKAMCSQVTKDKMPPKKYRDKHPEEVPSKEDIKAVCDWAQSLQMVK